MLLLGLGLVAAGLVHTATEAPITAVTVYSDRARVVRTATLDVSGTQRVELPRLPDLVDPDSIRVEAQGAEVSFVEVRPASAPPFPQEQARQVLDTLDRLDESIARLEAERAAYTLQVAALRRVQPVTPDGDAQADPRHATPAVAPAAWGTAAAFLVDTAAKLEQHLLELEDRVLALKDERQRRLSEAERLGERPRKPGIEVAVELAGSGAAKLQLAYMVPQHVRWYPRYELQLQLEQQRVQVAFSGSVSQNTGEDWDHAKLTLSTALPSNATALPRLATWKIGTTERFIPEPTRRHEEAGAPPSLPARAPEQDLEYELRKQLLARVGKPPPSRESPAQQNPAPDAGTTRSFQSQPTTSTAQSSVGGSRGSLPNSGRGTLLGVVIDGETRRPVPDVVVTATSPSLQGEETVVTDAQGNYRIPFLPAGAYTLRYEKEGFRPYARSDINLRLDHTLRINVQLLPEAFTEEVLVTGSPPTVDVGSSTQGVTISLGGVPPRPSGPPLFQSEPTVNAYVGLAPPPGWVPPALEADMPAVLAGGYDLAFIAPRLETVRSGHGERTIPLLIESWPVQVERHVFPALAADAYLVAQLKSPSRSVLPAGQASLFVGADPAGTAMLKLVVPGEPFTLPLGVDPAVRTARNVRLVQSKDGFISKDDLNTYEVTLEVPNPYPFPLQVRVVDQWPLSQDGKVEVKRLRTSPGAKQDDKTGELQWELVVPPSSKKTVSFEYSLRRPQGWRLTQSP